MEAIFKKEDKVYHFRYGWGEVIDDNYGSYGLVVQFKDDTEYFSGTGLDGNTSTAREVLSFTEYDLVKGGLSLVRPEPGMKKTDINRVKLIIQERTSLQQLNRDIVGNKLVFRPESMSRIETSKDMLYVLFKFCKKFNVKAILHFNFDHYIVTPDNIIDMGETKSYMANLDLIDESKEEMF